MLDTLIQFEVRPGLVEVARFPVGHRQCILSGGIVHGYFASSAVGLDRPRPVLTGGQNLAQTEIGRRQIRIVIDQFPVDPGVLLCVSGIKQ